MLSIGTGLLLGEGKYTTDNSFLVSNTSEELTDDTHHNLTNVTHFGDKQPVAGIHFIGTTA